MSVQLLPNAEALLVDFLRDQAEVTALCSQRIYTVLPNEHDTWPAVRVTRLGGRTITHVPLWLDAPFLQVDVWGGPKATAFTLTETIRAVIAERLAGVHDHGVVTKAEFGGVAFLPDQTWEPARPRYSLDLTLYTHP